ncbi:unnamed protein product [Porites evermanni]|uniref:C3H1-type domain-containing protein n=1 Tax=Porites evermanni TaxID=104178 RepID=A0ABN8M8D2_9CNID|nr:unnamed protein product [Porites evermanni]
MTSRPTRSQAAAFDAMISPAESNPSSSAANSSLPSPGSADPSATSQSPMSDQPSPAFLAAVVSAVKQALAAEQTSNLPSTPATSFALSVPMAASPGGVPGSCSSSSSTGQLDAQASSLAASGVGFSSVSPAVSAATVQGRPDFVVPAFVTTFASPISAVTLSTNTAAVTTSPSVGGISSLAQTPVLQQPFVVGPGFSPVPAKLVSQIVAGKFFVELHELLSSNLVLNEPETQLLFDEWLVLTSTPKKPKRRVDDITSWLEAFSIYCLILSSHFPHCWKDLMQYQLLILRTHRQFAGRVWLAYDRAFREHAAASNLTDWSSINVQLFNFHAAGASVRSCGELSEEFSEPRGAPSSLIICKSWNRGHCVAPSSSCRFAHKCSSCFGPHRVGACPGEASSQSRPSSKRPVDASPLHSSSKSRR